MNPQSLILGLGNPGPEYGNTRHNVGFWVVTLLSRRHGIPLDQHRHHSRYGIGQIGGLTVVLAQPMTYMNRSGRSAAALLKAFQLVPQQMLVIYDDLALPLGTLRIRPRGSAGSHKGMESIIAALGTQEFPRLRFAIGTPPPEVDWVDYVLSPFQKDEAEVVQVMLEHAADAVEAWLTEPIEKVMSQFNKKFAV